MAMAAAMTTPSFNPPSLTSRLFSITTASRQQPHLPEKPTIGVQDVRFDNLEEEMQKISRIAKKYSFIAIDTEFPGVLDVPEGIFETCADYEYALFKSNVDRMNIIQLGMSFFDESGRQPSPIHTWQFNFRFDLKEDLHNKQSIDLLTHSGIDFELHQTAGIERNHFAERLVTSGIICNEDIKFLTFHSAYDFGYLFKILEGTATLPRSEIGFLDIVRMYFPRIFDIKYMLKDKPMLKGGLQDLANFFKLIRTGKQHQAGSDSALTGALFFRLKQDILPDKLDHFLGQIYGLSGVLPIDRVRTLDNVFIRKNHDGSVYSPTLTTVTHQQTAIYGIKEASYQHRASSDYSSFPLSRTALSPSFFQDYSTFLKQPSSVKPSFSPSFPMSPRDPANENYPIPKLHNGTHFY